MASIDRPIPEPYWSSVEMPRFPAPELPRQVDVAVVGGGITGLTAALLLKRAGLRVAVFEKHRIGQGETGHTSAHLTCVTDLRLPELVRDFGRDVARRVWQSGQHAIDFIESTAADLDIACDFRRVPGFLVAALGRPANGGSPREDADLARAMNFPVRWVERSVLAGRPAMRIADQALFHPLKYVAGLARAVHGDGCLVAEDAEVADVLDDPRAVLVNGQTIECRWVVIATHVPLMGATRIVKATLLQTRLYPYSTYVLSARLPAGTLAPALYSDLSDPYYYLRVHEDDEGAYAIFGGEDHKTGKVRDTEARYTALETRLKELLPDAKVDRRWSGQVIETDDGLPFIGETAQHQLVATGYAGNGLTFGTLAGMMMHDTIAGIPNPMKDIFRVDRSGLRGGLGTRVAETMDYPVHLVGDRLRATSDSIDDVPAGEGRVISVNGDPVACSRDAAGHATCVSAVCTHMGCLVRWNGAERTWDCPCHGSRFTADGSVIGGPAETPLEPVDVSASAR